jgi:preprotein translocase subunit YajC
MTERKLGSEITFDGGTWGVIDFIDSEFIIVLDEDGGEHELTEARID